MANDTWTTPQDLWDRWNSHYHFTLDIAANEENHKCAAWWGPGGEVEDALSTPWPVKDMIWCNPPYSRGNQRRFVDRAVECAAGGGKVVMLLPCDTSTRLFHYIVSLPGVDVTLLQGRIKFAGADGPAKFGSMLVTFSDPGPSSGTP